MFWTFLVIYSFKAITRSRISSYLSNNFKCLAYSHQKSLLIHFFANLGCDWFLIVAIKFYEKTSVNLIDIFIILIVLKSLASISSSIKEQDLKDDI